MAGAVDLMDTLGETIRRRRQAKGLTVTALAGVIGVTKSYLSMIENERVANPPSAGHLVALERALGFTEGQLVSLADWSRTPRGVRDEFERVADAARRGEALARWLEQAAEAAQSSQRVSRQSVQRLRADDSSGGAESESEIDTHSGSGTGSGSGLVSNLLDELYRSGELAKRVGEALGTDDDPAAAHSGGGGGGGSGSGGVAVVPVRYKVPLINRVAAGYPSDFTDLDYPARVADEYVDCPDLTDPDAFAARVVGESMLPEYREGDVVVFSPAADVTSGCDCFVRIEPHHEATFKRVYFDSEGEQGGQSTEIGEKDEQGAGCSEDHDDAVEEGDPNVMIRLEPLNPKFASTVYPREQIAGLYRAVWKFQRLA